MRRIKYHRHINISIKNIIYIIVIIIIINTIIIIKSFTINSTKYLYNYAYNLSKEISSIIINTAMYDIVYDKNDSSDMVILNKNNEGQIISISFDNSLMNKKLYELSNKLHKIISNLESNNGFNKYGKKNVIFIPFGLIYNIPLLTDISPKIPIKISALGNTETYIHTKVTEYGINNSLLEVYINTTINIQIILPFSSEVISTQKDILLSSNIVQGGIPEYYGGQMSYNSQIAKNSK